MSYGYGPGWQHANLGVIDDDEWSHRFLPVNKTRLLQRYNCNSMDSCGHVPGFVDHQRTDCHAKQLCSIMASELARAEWEHIFNKIFKHSCLSGLVHICHKLMHSRVMWSIAAASMHHIEAGQRDPLASQWCTEQ